MDLSRGRRIPWGVALGAAAAVGIGLAAAVPAVAHAPHHARPTLARASRDLTYDPAHRTADLVLVAGQGGLHNGFNFDGAAQGQLVVTIPLGWKVVVRFANQGHLPHSAVIVPLADRQGPTYRPAFAGASTPNPAQGTPSGGTARFSFVASRAGQYAIVCAVPGHVDLGMWDRLVVSAQAKVPALRF